MNDWIIVSDGTPNMYYVGKYDGGEEIDNRPGQAIVLTECRAIRVLVMPTPRGIAQQVLVTPLPLAKGPLDIKVIPSSYWWARGQDPGMVSELETLIEKCKDDETNMRAQAAGIRIARETPR